VNVIKKSLLIFLIFLILLFTILPSFSYAGSLNDAQRKAIVDMVVQMIDEGNKARILRYSQGHRNYGYRWEEYKGNEQQLTRIYINVNCTPGTPDYIALFEAINRDRDLKKKKAISPATQAYYCLIDGDYLQGTIPFDCSSLVGAAYTMSCGTDYNNNPWCSVNYEKDSKFFDVKDLGSTDPEQGDILWKKGHVALYLGNCYGDGKKYVAEAYGFVSSSQNKQILHDALMDFLCATPEYIKEDEDYNKKMPRLNILTDPILSPHKDKLILSATKQVIIREYKQGRFDKVAKYTGPISDEDRRIPDFKDLKYTGSGLDHKPIVFNENRSVVWPKGFEPEDQNLVTSEGYFYKGTPTFGKYEGKIDKFNWLIEWPENVFDWLVGFVTYAIKGVFIGFTALVENVMSNILNFGVETEGEVPGESNNPTSENPNQNPITPETPSNTAQTGFNDEIKVLNKVTNTQALAYAENEFDNRGELFPIAVLGENPTPAETPTGNPASPNGEGKTDDGSTDTNIITSTLDYFKIKKKITVEDVIFNRVPLLDINFFDFENAGGEKLTSDSLIYKVRQTIASWYDIIRTAVIMGMLVVLMYLAIRIAISLPSQKAEYKSKLLQWVAGFIIVLGIHYFMLLVITVNNQIVMTLDNVATESTTLDKVEGANVETTNDGQTSLYEAIRVQAHDVRATTGWSATIIYMVLVYFLIRFVILYAKRLFTIAVLTVIAPIMGLLYSIDKKKYRIGDWAREYIYNVLIQFVHVVVYTSIVAVAYDFTRTATFRGGVIALVALGFVLIAEGMVKKIFGFNKASSSGSLLNSTIQGMAAYGVTKSIIDKTQKHKGTVATAAGTTKSFGKKLYTNWLHKHMSMSEWDNKYKKDLDKKETEEEARERRKNRVLDSKAYKPNTYKFMGIEFILSKDWRVPIGIYREKDKGKKENFTVSNIDNTIADLNEEENEARKAYRNQGLSDAWNSATGAFSLMASIPMLVVSPKYGLGLTAYGIHGLTSSMGRRKIKGATSNVGGKLTGTRLMFAFATMGMSEGMRNMNKNLKDQLSVLETTYPQRRKLLEEMRVSEHEMAVLIAEMELERKRESGNLLDGTESEKVREKKQEIDETLRNLDKQDFEAALGATLEQIKDKDIQKIVGKFVMDQKVPGITEQDLKAIAAQLEKVVGDKYKNITLSSEFSEKIRDEIRDRIVKYGNYSVVGEAASSASTGEQGGDESYSSASSSGERVHESYTSGSATEQKARGRYTTGSSTAQSAHEQQFDYREKYARNTSNQGDGQASGVGGRTQTNKGRTATTSSGSHEEQFDYRAKYGRTTSSQGGDEKASKQQGAGREQAGKTRTNLNEEHIREEENQGRTQQNQRTITKEQLERKVDEALNGMRTEELVDIINSTLKRKGAVIREIKNPKYRQLMEKVERLRALDDEYKELTGESAYKKYTEEDGKIVPKRDNDGDIEYMSISELVKTMRNHLVDFINSPVL